MTEKTKKAYVEAEIVTGTIDNIKLPPKPVVGRATKYPFDDLAPGAFFSVKNKEKRQLASPIANANKKYRNEAKDAAGKVVSTTQEREFYAVDVDAALSKQLKGTPHEGATVIVIRNK